MVTCGGPARLETRELVFEDSRLRSWKVLHGELRVLIEGSVLVTVGAARTSWSQELEIVVSGAALLSEPREDLWLVACELQLGEERIERVFLPFEGAGEVRLELRCGDGASLQAAGTRVSFEETGEATFLERLEQE